MVILWSLAILVIDSLFEGNGNVDDSQFTNKTSGNGGTDSN